MYWNLNLLTCKTTCGKSFTVLFIVCMYGCVCMYVCMYVFVMIRLWAVRRRNLSLRLSLRSCEWMGAWAATRCSCSFRAICWTCRSSCPQTPRPLRSEQVLGKVLCTLLLSLLLLCRMVLIRLIDYCSLRSHHTYIVDFRQHINMYVCMYVCV